MSDALNPSEYFEKLKDKKKSVTDADLNRFYDNAISLLEKAQKTGQTDLMRRLVFTIDCIEKERELVKVGINTFVYREDITEYIKNVAKKVVKIIELEKYPREIPDEIVDIIDKYGYLFDQMYVVFTDYTGEVEKQVEKARRDKDPILFGTFKLNSRTPGASIINERFYFLGDWVDPYCDLTLDKMVAEMNMKDRGDIKRSISAPIDLDEIRNKLAEIEAKSVSEAKNIASKSLRQNKGFFSRIKTFFVGD